MDRDTESPYGAPSTDARLVLATNGDKTPVKFPIHNGASCVCHWKALLRETEASRRDPRSQLADELFAIFLVQPLPIRR